ncbi:VIT1/CCC1 transporter family protein [Acidipropionibacterium jensenii]|uniref:VIT family n=2 Tax=Acidipropionibacterium jensenii TaxID=1749 RepID=A0A448P2W9_9ACTN|nr:VIT family protein [Acidipropionibacterium jensenii]MDN5978508.1 VIT family protein [Acidipropionibacterium jensenii]MDN5997475.1 VIT family protein [Acidipropionibacterium jensenii]MDN6442874.1 VIT family protein [Acidipropionibacterium jensenii]MDN6481544.1 VIT family protein [Acidipropionibacterium jensenii]MDN6592530.1 VIT family protein [Acidipropionibacterium jensenii]
MDQRLNWLRAGVLGANDGIVSTAGVVIGVAGATSQTFAIATAGIAALVAGAFSMAGGEYVSVSTQRDTERALLAKEQWELDTMPDTELKELTDIYVDRGVTPDVAALVARDLTARDPLRAHAEAELGIDPDDLTNPWLAAVSSLVSFSVGAAIPLIAILLPLSQAVLICVLAVALALAITGLVSAHLGGAPKVRAVLRNIGMGLLTMAVTYGVGRLFGTVAGA